MRFTEKKTQAENRLANIKSPQPNLSKKLELKRNPMNISIATRALVDFKKFIKK